MKVEVLYFEGCPNHKPAVERVQSVLKQQGIVAELTEIEVPNAETAKAMRFPGSPTIRVNGLDIDPTSRTATEIGFACRCYEGGLPSEDMIRAALRQTEGQAR
jgi:hypothetical protein